MNLAPKQFANIEEVERNLKRKVITTNCDLRHRGAGAHQYLRGAVSPPFGAKN